MSPLLLRQLEALSDESRLRIVALISRCSQIQGLGATTQQVAETLKIKPGVASHHLTILAQAELLTRTQSGKYAIFTLNELASKELLSTLSTFFTGTLTYESL
jgi:DNA-binding transcriptional ArsR family regulator